MARRYRYYLDADAFNHVFGMIDEANKLGIFGINFRYLDVHNIDDLPTIRFFFKRKEDLLLFILRINTGSYPI